MMSRKVVMNMNRETWRLYWLLAALFLAVGLAPPATAAADRPNVVLVYADDLGFSDLGCYGSEIATHNLDQLAARGLRFTQFYNAARCCPTRAAVLTGLYPHQAGVGHMLQNWQPPGYTAGLNQQCATIAELLRHAGYRTYHIGKWHVGGVGGKSDPRNHPLNRGFDRAYGTGGGGSFFAPRPLYLDREEVKPGDDYYVTDAFTEWSVKFLEEHGRAHGGKPFLLHLCYTAPHFPLHAKPKDIAKYRGKYREGWDALRERRFTRQKELGIIPRETKLSPRDPVAQAWADVAEAERDDWDLRMAVHAAMIDCMDQGVGRVLAAVRALGAEQNTLVVFFSDNGASAEFLDSWPNPARGHQPGSVIGTRESHRCLEVGWANAANTPFREHKMWVHEGGIATPFIACWPAGIQARGGLAHDAGHVIDLMPTLLEIAGVGYPKKFQDHELLPMSGRSLVPVFNGGKLGERELAWEHEGNRAIRVGDWKLVARFRGDWELYDLRRDRTEVNNLAASEPERVKALANSWQKWADAVGVVPWEKLPGSAYKPGAGYRKKSEPVEP
jgi:arylsulfatase